jgi:MYXO-CTERM domain-containing protein
MDIACQTAAQCPAGWSCQTENVATGAAACPPGTTCSTLPVPPPPPSKCVPPYYGANSGGDLEVPSTPTTGTGTGAIGTGTISPGLPSTGTAGSGPTGIPNEGTPPNKGTPEPTTSAQSHDVSACAMGHAPASSGALALLAMLGALFGLKRRRA